eukprot:3824982-Rhodomonas_salina.1
MEMRRGVASFCAQDITPTNGWDVAGRTSVAVCLHLIAAGGYRDRRGAQPRLTAQCRARVGARHVMVGTEHVGPLRPIWY